MSSLSENFCILQQFLQFKVWQNLNFIYGNIGAHVTQSLISRDRAVHSKVWMGRDWSPTYFFHPSWYPHSDSPEGEW